MSFASSSDKETPQTLWADQKKLGGRIILTIPFGSKEEEMQGFVSALGSKEEGLPVLTICVEKPTGGAVVSTIVFPSSKSYMDFVTTLWSDSSLHFFDGEEF